MRTIHLRLNTYLTFDDGFYILGVTSTLVPDKVSSLHGLAVGGCTISSVRIATRLAVSLALT